MTVPLKRNLVIYQGANWRFRWRLVDKDGNPFSLAGGFKARLQVRVTDDDTVKIVDATTENGLMTIDQVNGYVDLDVPAATTELLSFETGVYDTELIYPGGDDVDRIGQGRVTLDTNVTR